MSKENKTSEKQQHGNDFIADVSGCSLELIEKLANCNISKNHTGRWGVIFGSFSRTYSFMHEDKNEVLKWIRENYR